MDPSGNWILSGQLDAGDTFFSQLPNSPTFLKQQSDSESTSAALGGREQRASMDSVTSLPSMSLVATIPEPLLAAAPSPPPPPRMPWEDTVSQLNDGRHVSLPRIYELLELLASPDRPPALLHRLTVRVTASPFPPLGERNHDCYVVSRKLFLEAEARAGKG